MKKILIADDDPAICDAICMILEEEGYEVTTTVNGATVLEMTHDMPDLLLLDIWMSGVDGREIAKKLKSDDKTKIMPIIMVSASREIEKSAKEAGANDFLAKPFKMNELLSKVKKSLQDSV